MYDLRRGGGDLLPPVSELPNAPAFAGGACPVAALRCIGGAAPGVLVSSGIGWWTGNKRALEEAPEGAASVACLNVRAAANGECHPTALKWQVRALTKPLPFIPFSRVPVHSEALWRHRDLHCGSGDHRCGGPEGRWQQAAAWVQRRRPHGPLTRTGVEQ